MTWYRLGPVLGLMMLIGVGSGVAQRAPGEQNSSNVRVLSHIPLGRSFSTTEPEIEQELSRPYVYVTRMLAPTGFEIVSVKDPARPGIIYSWRIDLPELHAGTGAMSPAYLKARGRYYFVQSFQFSGDGPDTDLGAIVFDVTGLPDTSKVREVGRIKLPTMPGGIHEIFAYKHSDGRSLLFATTTGRQAHIYDIEQFAAGAGEQGLVGRIPIPENNALPRPPMFHDFYIGYEPASRQDRFYGAVQPYGNYIFDVTRPESPKLITAILGAPGQTWDHTFVVSPDGRYAMTEAHLPYRPVHFYDLKPGLDGQAKTVTRPIGAWTANWQTSAHNLEMRWPYLFISAYESGLQIVNVMDPTNPYTVGYYDTYSGPHKKGFGGARDPEGGTPSFNSSTANGAFGIDIRNADGLIVIGDFKTGFWTLKMDGFDGWNGHQWGVPNISSAQDWDNGPDGAPKPQKVS